MAGFTDNQLFEDTCIKVYNPEEKKLIGVFKNAAKASNRLGVKSGKLLIKCGSRERIFSPLLQKQVACRVATITEEDKKLIKKTEVKFPYE
jgi:hypothetical protein